MASNHNNRTVSDSRMIFRVSQSLCFGFLLLMGWNHGVDSRRVAAQSPVSSDAEDKESDADRPYTPKSQRELQRTLTKLQYDVTQNAATEPAFKNRYWNNKRSGVYNCVVCALPLFDSETKFKSGTGWPSFFQPIGKKSVATKTDYILFYPRTEVHCSRCNAHLGHVFDDGPQPTGLRYCMNSASLQFVAKAEPDAKEEKSSATEE